MTATKAIGWFFGAIIDRIVRWLALSRIHPNVLTFIGLLINIGAAWLFALGGFAPQGSDPQAWASRCFLWAGVVVICAGLFDMVDGRVARATQQVTRFGGFFDSVIDRFFYIVLTAIVMTGSVMVSYTRARAENVIPTCKVGFLERPERVVLIILGALANRMAPVLWVIAVLSNLTVVHRMIFTWQECKRLEDAQLRAAPVHEQRPASKSAKG
jgi:CDP-diacylglycerol--glycerol-3-phosphate 3-phosphatidyltransferase